MKLAFEQRFSLDKDIEIYQYPFMIHLSPQQFKARRQVLNSQGYHVSNNNRTIRNITSSRSLGTTPVNQEDRIEIENVAPNGRIILGDIMKGKKTKKSRHVSANVHSRAQPTTLNLSSLRSMR
ncbi:hypothetical protein AKO1_009803 [Acrasis kona]|uniref:Uncharacterized protein n=1 Tax=Acrasis kona TaxID=1008807 RepID=A0AAW2ZN62_9EUKA